MKQILRLVYAKVLLLLSFNAYAQSDTRSFDLVNPGKKNANQKESIAQVQSSSQKRKKSKHAVPDIRRELAPNSISLYPNPVVDQLRVDVDLNEWQGGIIIIKSRSGRVIAQQRVLDSSVGFNLGRINRGVYLLTVRKGGAEKTVEVIKL